MEGVGFGKFGLPVILWSKRLVKLDKFTMLNRAIPAFIWAMSLVLNSFYTYQVQEGLLQGYK
jgi:hypothetical protein